MFVTYSRHFESTRWTQDELDLLSFSSLNLTPLRVTPLRAVYSGATVGIKYMFPLSPSTSSQPVVIIQFIITALTHVLVQTYNQIQLRFAS